LIALLALGCSKAELPNQTQPKTILEVTAVDNKGVVLSSVAVAINGEIVGETPYVNEEAPAGNHALRLTKEGYKIYSQQVIIEKGQPNNVEGILEPLPATDGQLLVTTNFDSVDVKVVDTHGNTVGSSYLRSSSYVLTAGGYVVSGAKAGCETIVEAVEIEAGRTTTVNLQLVLPQSQPPTLTFSVKEDSVRQGEEMTLNWQTDGYQVIIDQGIGTRGPKGSEKIIAQNTGQRIFTATAYSRDNLTTPLSDTVYIIHKPVAPSLTFSVLEDSVEFGKPVNLEWNSDGHQVIIDQGVGPRGPYGSEEKIFGNPGWKFVTAAAYGDDNLVTIKRDSVLITEANNPVLPIVMLAATRKVSVNGTATISWFSLNADYIVVDFVDNPALYGQAQTSFSTAGIRVVTATAYNADGYTTAKDTIEVVEPEVTPIDDIVVGADVTVRADQGASGYESLDAATVTIVQSGYYRVLVETWYNSGDSQRNESFYLQLRGTDHHAILPNDPNAGDQKVVPDDPGEPHTATRDGGRFYLEAGTKHIDVYHYAKISGQYTRFLDGAIDGPESVKIKGFKLVFIN
jgi:hypothetical protein